MSQGIWIAGARLVDPVQGLDSVGHLIVRRGKIVSLDPGDVQPGDERIDAPGCLVIPGLIDFHAHLAHWLTDTGVHPDLMCLPNGITAAVDAGSAGTAGAEGFIRHTIANAETTIKLFLNVSAVGVATEQYNENPDPDLFDRDAMFRLCEQYPEHILGLKIRLGRGFSDGLGVRSLDAAKRIAGELGKPLCVHYTNGDFPCAEVLNRLEKNDIFCHCFQGRGATVIDAAGRVDEAVRAARRRGVVFDAAMGRINYDLDIIASALAQGFPPDIISTDVVATSVYGHKLFHLLYTMSLFLNLGMPLADVVRAAACVPAAHMGLEGRIGTLRPGAVADVAILWIREREMTLSDQFGHSIRADRLLVPLATIKRGRMVYKRVDFEF